MVAKVRKKKAKTSKAKASTVKKTTTKAKKKAAKPAPAKKTVKKTTTTTKAKAKPKIKTKAKSPAAVQTQPQVQGQIQSQGSTVLHGLFEPYQPDKTEEYMNDKQLAHFRAILNTWRKELMEEVDSTILGLQQAFVLADPSDQATQTEVFNLELRARDRERKLIKKIEMALGQIEEKEYGYCEACGVEIGIRRLEARPTATLCIDCKTLDEIKEKRS